jgi:UDP-N-acetyl-D-glucosamine dehydrogenase
MPQRVVEKVALALSDRRGLPVKGARILLVGVAYKKNIEDVRESPVFRIAKLLMQRGARLDYHDPFVPELPHSPEASVLAGRRSVAIAPERLAKYDAVLIITDHDCIDYRRIAEHARLVIDTRNACARTGVVEANIIKT